MKKSLVMAVSFALVLVGAAACGGGKSAQNAANTAASSATNAMSSAGNAASNAMSSAGNAMSSMKNGAENAMGGNIPNCGAVKAVWVNLKTKAYHEPGDPYYGKTKHGEYLCPAQAKAQGFHAAGAAKTSQ